MFARCIAFWLMTSALLLTAGELQLRFNGQPVPQHSLAEFAIDGVATNYADPLDEREIALQAQITLPDGHVISVDGYYDVPFKRAITNPHGKVLEKWESDGTPRWTVRFAPWQTGRHAITVTAHDQRATDFHPISANFECVPSTVRGNLRLPAPGSPFLRCDDGQPWLLIGENMCWARSDRGMTDFDQWLPALAKAGGNFIRVWMEGPGNFRLEPHGKKGGAWNWDFRGPARLDYLLERCQAFDVKTMICLLTFGDFRREFRWRENPPWYPWQTNPYNVVCGGPCQKPEDFWTNPEAQRRFKEYLRYWIARFGGYTSVGFWEFWNEVDIYADPAIWQRTEPACAAWHEQMGAWLRARDPYQHIITTSFGGYRKSPLWEQPHIEVVQTHSYGRKDLAAAVFEYSDSQLMDYRKPHLFGEIGNDVHGDHDVDDHEGVGLHNALWAGLVSGSVGGAAVWWWDGHVHPDHLYYHYAGVAKFVQAVAGADNHGWAALPNPGTNAAPLRLTTTSSRRYTRDLHLPDGVTAWEPHPANQTNEFVVTREGELLDNLRHGQSRLAGTLHGLGGHRNLHNPVLFHLDNAQPLEFVVTVDGVSGYGGANLHLSVDGQEKLFKDLPRPAGSKSTATITAFNAPYAVAVPAGRHCVTVENTGRDWVLVHFSIPGYLHLTSDRVLRAAGLVGMQSMVAWVQNRDATWANALAATNSTRSAKIPWPPEPVPDVALEIVGLQLGRYEAQVWDTFKGEPLAVKTIYSMANKLLVPLPPISRDVAVWVRRCN